MREILIVGGANGIGLSIAHELVKREKTEKVYIVDKSPLVEEFRHSRIESFVFDLIESDYTFFDQFNNIDGLMITAGFGKLALFENLDEQYIVNSFNVNTVSVIRLIKHFYHKLLEKKIFNCGIMVSIAGFMSSPFFSVYGATKAALRIFIESVNVELEKSGTTNRILNVSPGSIKGTSFNQGRTDLSATSLLAHQIIEHLEKQSDLFIPLYEEVFRTVLERYQKDFREEGRHSYEYKLSSGRIKE